MQASLAKPLDWCTIQLARLNVRDAVGKEGLAARAQALLEHPDFLGDFVTPPEDFRFVTKRSFQFPEPLSLINGRQTPFRSCHHPPLLF